MKIESLFQSQLSDLLDGEKQLETALPFLIQAADWAPLRLTLLQYQQLTRKQEKRLELIFWNLGVSPLGGKCKALGEIVEEILTPPVTTPTFSQGGLPASRFSVPPERLWEGRVITFLQKANNYETAGYSTLSVWTTILDYREVSRPLEMSLQESRAMQRWLGSLAARHADQFIPPANIVAPAFPSRIQPLTSPEGIVYAHS